jgi:flavin reductase (DIM6/NTAB) family NADH-FMN oxidoreductase RutF
MHYDPQLRNHGLPHDPFTAIVVPRPIGWISTVDSAGLVNLAPYSFFNAVSARPPFVIFGSSNPKDSQNNAEATGEFVVNLATWELREQVNQTSATLAPEVDEAALVGLEMAPSMKVRPPRVKRSPVALECVHTQTVQVASRDGRRHQAAIVVGEVVSIYIDDAVIVDGRVDATKLRPISRLGYMDYGLVEGIFSMQRPR